MHSNSLTIANKTSCYPFPHVSFQSCIATDSSKFCSLLLINSEWSLQKWQLSMTRGEQKRTEKIFNSVSQSDMERGFLDILRIIMSDRNITHVGCTTGCLHKSCIF